MPNEMNHAEVAEKMEYLSNIAIRADHFICLSSYDLTAMKQAASIIRRIANRELVEVVHCKDCKFWLDDGFGKICCGRVGVTRKADFYCANGKRKDDGEK